MTNPMKFTIDTTNPAPYSFNAFIPFGKLHGIHVFIDLKEKCFHIQKRSWVMAWIDFADHSQDYDAYIDEMEWAEAYFMKYGVKA
jgi:hypothetical protein